MTQHIVNIRGVGLKFDHEPTTQEIADAYKRYRARKAREAVQGAQAYARFDRSDPFALKRALSHIVNGVAADFFDEKGRRHDGGYTASEGIEERDCPDSPTGATKYNVPTFTNVARP